MPKKMGINTKAVEARARKEEKKQAERVKIEKAKEDEYWKDDDKNVQRKEQRKAELEKKKQETLEKKALKLQLYEEEMSSLKSAPQATKVTRAQISKTLDSQLLKPKPKVNEAPLEENINRIQVEGDEARSVQEAIAVLSFKEPELDRHPERRVKAAFTSFEERMMPKYKAEHPNLRLSQIKQLLKKEWLRSSENPLNQPHSSYNAPKKS